VLIYNYPITTDGQAANLVLGQPDFVSSGFPVTATGMNEPEDVAEDSAGNLYVSDYSNCRVLQFKPPFTNGMAASLVIGQPDFVTNTCNTTQNGNEGPVGLAFDGSGNLWVVDYGSSRILEYVPPFTTDMNASLVIGQPNFTTNTATTTSTGLNEPYYIAFDASGNLWVPDSTNNRVLKYVPPFTTGMAASLVIGQTDFVSSGSNTTASSLDYPTGIAFDRAGNLWIGDTENDRVLEFVPAFATGMSASVVLGQPDFITAACNATQNGLCAPFGLDFDSRGNMAVADYGNNRTMAFKPPFMTDQLAEGVLGQPNFVTSTATTTATGQDEPFSVRPLY
jgi:sugar lactone lactonase YvrE